MKNTARIVSPPRTCSKPSLSCQNLNSKKTNSMITKILIPGALLALLCATTQAQLPMADNSAPPGWQYYQQAYLPGVVFEGTNTIDSPQGASGNNDAETYVSNPDRQSKAQSFTTGPSPLGYTLQSFTFQQAQGPTNTWLNNGTYFLLNNGDNVLVRIGTLPGPQATAYTAMLTTNATYTGTTYNQGGTSSALGIYFTLNLSGALPTLAANTTYFVEIMATGSDHFELNNTATNSTDPVNFPLSAPLYTNGAALIGRTTAGLDATGNFRAPAQGGEFAFVASLTAVGAPTVVASANPSSAAPGQAFKVTATITAGVGTVTNVTVDLSGIAGSSAATLVRSNTANVYTNTFTVPVASLFGTTNLTVIATQNTQPLVGAARVSYTVFSASQPAIVKDISPTNSLSIYVGQGVTFSAAFSGAPPIYYYWQHSDINSFVFTNIPNATNTTFTIPSAALSDAGVYQLEASNSFGTTLSFYSYLIVNSGNPTYLWSAPIPFSGLNADQILTNFPGTKVAGALVGKNGGSPIVVTNSSADSPIVFAGSGTWASLSGGAGYNNGFNTNLTGNANFNTCLNDGYNDNAIHTITMNGLVLGQQYQVQLFGLDDRTGLSPLGSARLVNYQDPNNVNDKSQNTAMSDNVYMLATFTATNTTMTIQQNMVVSSGNFNCLVLRAVGSNPPPYFTVEPKSGARYLGTNGILSASAAGDATISSPTIIYQWQAGPTNGPFTNLVEGAKYVGTTTTNLTVNNLAFSDGLPAYLLVARNGGGSVTSSVANIFVIPRALLGQWFSGATNLNDVSGYSPTNTHDGYTVGTGTYSFSSDVPPGWTGQSLRLSAGNTGIAIGNSSTLDASYTNTFDDDIQNAFTVAFWAHGYPGQWAKWVCKNGDSGSPNAGWAVRDEGDNNDAGLTMRSPGGTVTLGSAVFGNSDDNRGTIPSNNGLWHHYAGVYSTLTGIRSFYVDGVLSGQETNNGVYNLAAYSHIVIGGRDNSPGNSFGDYFTGNIYDVRVYDYDLTASQVAQLATLPDPVVLGQPPTNTTAYAGFNAQISATVRGTAPITNQWKFNGTNLVDGVNGGVLILGSTSNVLSIYGVTTNNAGVYTLAVTNSLGSAVSSNALLTIVNTVPAPATNLVGAWLTGAANLIDTSGYSPNGTHDGYGVTGAGVAATNYAFTTDVPPGAAGQSLTLGGSTAIAIANSSTNTDLGLASTYTNTFDNLIYNSFTVTCWAKGNLGAWNAFVTKGGDFNTGWALREGSGGGIACWTVRGSGGTEDMQGPNLGNDQQWHFYAGTYDLPSGTRSLYVDGVLRGQYTGQTAYADSMGHLTFGTEDRTPGNNYGNNGYYNGKLYGVRIYNVGFNEAQVNSLFAPAPRPVPAFSVKPAVTSGSHGNQFVLTWSYGTLLQATNVAGPWTTNTAATQPYTVIISNAPAMFFKLSYP
jgi:hypothetical protein